jgi:hypothetical protein
MDPKWNFLAALWEHRKALIVLVLIVSLIAPPVRAQFGIDWARPLSRRSTEKTAISIRSVLRYARSMGRWNAELIDEQPAGLLH